MWRLTEEQRQRNGDASNSAADTGITSGRWAKRRARGELRHRAPAEPDAALAFAATPSILGAPREDEVMILFQRYSLRIVVRALATGTVLALIGSAAAIAQSSMYGTDQRYCDRSALSQIFST